MSGARDDDDEHPTDITGVVPLLVADESTARVAFAHRLVCVAGPDLGRTYRVGTTATIGRGSVDVALNSKDVSRNHARIVMRDQGFAIEDLGSANGTFVNGTQIRGRVALATGDRIQVGGAILVFARHDELEDRMYQLQRLEALASLAGGLAHDFNNALSVILSSVELLERRAANQAQLLELIGEVKGAASSASLLARRLLRLGHTEPLEFEPVLLGPLVQRTVAMLRRQLPPRIAIRLNVPGDLIVHGSQEELHQVLLNLMLNARDAMPDGGTLRIGARAVTLDRRQAATYHVPAHGDYAEIAVSDTGTGMDDETKARAFDPFFTTKPPSEGTGLGLAIIHGIVRRHGGAAVLDSAPGRGTTIKIWLPIALS